MPPYLKVLSSLFRAEQKIQLYERIAFVRIELINWLLLESIYFPVHNCVSFLQSIKILWTVSSMPTNKQYGHRCSKSGRLLNYFLFRVEHLTKERLKYRTMYQCNSEFHMKNINIYPPRGTAGPLNRCTILITYFKEKKMNRIT